MAGVITVLVVDDNPIVRAALRGILDGVDACAWSRRPTRPRGVPGRAPPPAVTLLDHRMPIADGLSASASCAGTPTCSSSPATPTPADRRMLRGGARGYLRARRRSTRGSCCRAVLAVAAGHGWLSPVAASVAASVVRDRVDRECVEQRHAERRRLARSRSAHRPRG